MDLSRPPLLNSVSAILRCRTLFILRCRIFRSFNTWTAKLVKRSVTLPKSSFEAFVPASRRIKVDQAIARDSALGHSLYNSMKNRGTGSSPFVLLDGPPYANGQPHVGHAINKVLKDIFCRYRSMTGSSVDFVPGWDCHGLPIELKISKTMPASASIPNIIDSCDASSRAAVSTQRTEFQSWGVSADWLNPYVTSSFNYISRELDAFHTLFERGFVYRKLKPVYYSPSSRTTLASAELEYNDQFSSHAVFVTFPLRDAPGSSVVVWTTTPWTLFFNDAIFFNPKIQYVEVNAAGSGVTWVLAEESVDALSAATGKRLKKVGQFSPEGRTYDHPILTDGRVRRIHPADFVKSGVGSGFVHGSFAHGFDDAAAAEALGYKVSMSSINDDGCFPTDFIVPELRSKSVLGEGNELAAQLFRPFSVHEHAYVHSYPCDWRTKEPVIIRSSLQWFVDCERLKPRALELLDQVAFFPESARTRMVLQLTLQPSWCISRQRVWGTPIPVWYDEAGNHYVDRRLTRYFLDELRSRGREVWWNGSMERLPEKLLCEANMDGLTLSPGRDIFDIWFDSGLAWFCGRDLEHGQADLVVEGHDQFRGWFNTSILTSVAMQDKIPFRNIVVHGFALDSEGRKMSKSLGNVVHPKDVTERQTDLKSLDPTLRAPVLGVDGLRYWVALSGTNTAAYVGKEHLKDVYKRLHKLRVTFKFILGSIGSDLEQVRKMRSSCVFSPLDLWMLHMTQQFVKDCQEGFENFDTSRVTMCELEFVRNVLSAVYFNSIKDRLYCDELDSRSRRSAQVTLLIVLDALLGVLSPILPHLTEEVASHCEGMRCGDVFARGWPDPLAGIQSHSMFDYSRIFNSLLPVREQFVASFSGSTADQEVILNCGFPERQTLLSINGGANSVSSDLCLFFKCASVELRVGEEFVKRAEVIAPHGDAPLSGFTTHLQWSTRKTDRLCCRRCRRFIAVGPYDICERCESILVNRVPCSSEVEMN